MLLLLLLVGVVASDNLPFWPHYPTRTTYVLDGTWKFGFAGNVDPLQVDPQYTPTNTTIAVPGAYDATAMGIEGRRGVAYYKTSLQTTGKPGLLYLAACSFYCRVFVDNIYVGEHRAGGYQPFWLAVEGSVVHNRQILVVVDNRYNKTLAPTHTGGDFYEYGGITRNVIWHERPDPVYLKQIEVFTIDANKGEMQINVVLGNTTAASSVTHVKVAVRFDNGSYGSTRTVAVEKLRGTINSINIPNPKLWYPDAPNLHTCTVELLGSDGKPTDAIQARFGIRQLGISKDKNSRITINGKVYKLHGVNRHTMWPDDGSALNLQQVQMDVSILKDLGVNYVRGAHYPQDQRFLDLCDEQGITIWEETLGPGVSLRDLESQYFLKYQVEAVNEMIDASVNHPCVILHAFYNEGPSNEEKARHGYNVSAQAIRDRRATGLPSPTWFVTWASNHKTSDKCLDIADVVSFNSYPAWYDHPGDLNRIKPFWESQISWVAQHYPSKPFCISETGAGGVYEWMNKTDVRWSQLYQQEVVERDIQVALGAARLSGLTIWQFNDIKANEHDTSKCGQCSYLAHPKSLSQPWTCGYVDVNCGRPKGENNKGQVDFWRRKKLTYTTMKQLYHNSTLFH